MKNCTSVKDKLEQRRSFRYASHTKLSTLKNTQKDINGYGRHLYLLLQQRQNDRLKIAENFSRPGWSVFIDLTIQPGQRFDQEIQSELQQARAAVALWSFSKNFWQKIQMKRLKKHLLKLNQQRHCKNRYSKPLQRFQPLMLSSILASHSSIHSRTADEVLKWW